MKEFEIKKFAEVSKTPGSYIINGEKVPRVTTICNMIAKPNLYFWYGKYGTAACKKISQTSMEFGSLFHKLAELRMNGQKVHIKQYQKDMRGCYHAFIKWRRQYQFGHIETEVLLQSQKYGYAGTCDLVGDIDSIICVVDWKTSADLYLEYPLQVSAYMQAFHEMTGVTPEFGGVLIVGKDGKFQYHDFSWKFSKWLFRGFLGALRIWKAEQRNWKSKIHTERG